MEQRVILLVEDNADDEELTKRAFRHNKISNPIVVARDGVEALDYLLPNGTAAADRPPVAPQIVLLDLKLPRIDGLEVLRRLRSDARTSLVPVVILTSSAEDEDVIESYRLGANAYVRKPVDYERFLEAAKQLGMFWLLVNRPPPTAESPKKPTRT